MGRTYALPEHMREGLAKPLGRLYAPPQIAGPEFAAAIRAPPMVITVGDRVTETVSKAGRTPDVQVVDGRENRKERAPPDAPYSRLIQVDNPAGTITQEAIAGLREAFAGSKPVRVSVRGEEDLLAIPAIALSPLSAVLFYGQPGEGIVEVPVGSAQKARNRALLAEMGIVEIG